MNKELFYQYWSVKGIKIISPQGKAATYKGKELWDYTARALRDKELDMLSCSEHQEG